MNTHMHRLVPAAVLFAVSGMSIFFADVAGALLGTLAPLEGQSSGSAPATFEVMHGAAPAQSNSLFGSHILTGLILVILACWLLTLMPKQQEQRTAARPKRKSPLKRASPRPRVR